MRADASDTVRPDSAWLVGLAVVVLLPLVTGAPAVALILSGLYLIVSGLWSLVRPSTWLGALGRRAASAVAAAGLVVVLAGGAVAGPPEGGAVPDDPAVAPTAAPTPPARTPTPAATPTARPEERASAAPSPDRAPDADDTGTSPENAQETALATALVLEVKGRAPRTGYDRDLFGSGWVDTDGNGCDTRNDMLARDLTMETFRPGTRDCVVLSGLLADPYSGRTIEFLRGNETSNAVQIDHVVALSDAWQKGAQQWDGDTRVRFANDPRNLLAVDGPLNMQKGDGDTATWLPPSKSYRCAYVARQVGVKHTYGLWVTQAEQAAMVSVLSTCPQEPLPDGSDVPMASAGAGAVGGAAGTPAASVPPAPATPAPVAPAPAEPVPPSPAPASVYFRNCSEARAAGAAPVHAGDAGYGTHLDRDRDGVGCE